MKLLKLHIENFGTLQDFELSPSAGLNVLYQKNGWGKSTLAVFIKAMLYGLPATTRRSLDENERKKYTPWQGGAYGGSIEFSTSKGSFRAERFFGNKESEDSFALYDLATNKPSSVYSCALGEELFGIDADGFERSTYLSQRHLTGSRDNNSISAKLGNLLDDVGDVGNYDSAMAALDKRRKYYVMTGNRGAIAETEAEYLRVQGELEHCRSIELALSAQEEQLSECVRELEEVEQLIEENRTRLTAAGLARERTALANQKQKMEEELASLRARHQQTDRFFRGATPTIEEWRSYCDLYDELKAVNVQRNFLAGKSQGREQLQALRKRFADGVPSDALLMRMEQDGDALRELRIREDSLLRAREQDAPAARFAEEAPSASVLDGMRARLQKAKEKQAEADELPERAAPGQKRSLWVVLAGAGVALVGLILGILGLVPKQTLPLLAIGILAFVAGIATALGGWMGRRKNRAALQKEMDACRQEAREYVEIVSAFLKKFGMDSRDPHRALAELTMLTEQYREATARAQRTDSELSRIRQNRAVLTAKLRDAFSHYFADVPQKEDYRTELESLRREVQSYRQLENAEKKRLADITAAEQRMEELKNELQPFLAKYDPSGTMSAGDCLEHIGSQRAERSRLAREIAHKESELKAFVAEKQLADLPEVAETEDYAVLQLEAQRLQARATELHKKQATQKSIVERLSDETDRISDLEAQLVRLSEQLAQAKANSATVAHTQKLLEEAKQALSTRYLGGMQSAFINYMGLLTGGQTTDAVMDTSFEVSLREGGKTRAMESFSRGWRDAVEFCTRLSLTGALYAEGEKPFLMLDDPFVNLDDNRLDAAKSMLEQLSNEYQIFYFVCHRDRI